MISILLSLWMKFYSKILNSDHFASCIRKYYFRQWTTTQEYSDTIFSLWKYQHQGQTWIQTFSTLKFRILILISSSSALCELVRWLLGLQSDFAYVFSSLKRTEHSWASLELKLLLFYSVEEAGQVEADKPTGQTNIFGMCKKLKRKRNKWAVKLLNRRTENIILSIEILPDFLYGRYCVQTEMKRRYCVRRY